MHLNYAIATFLLRFFMSCSRLSWLMSVGEKCT